MSSHYKVLGLEPGVGFEDVRRQYKRQALQFHPDKSIGDKNANDAMAQLNDAYNAVCEDLARSGLSAGSSLKPSTAAQSTTSSWASDASPSAEPKEDEPADPLDAWLEGKDHANFAYKRHAYFDFTYTYDDLNHEMVLELSLRLWVMAESASLMVQNLHSLLQDPSKSEYLKCLETAAPKVSAVHAWAVQTSDALARKVAGVYAEAEVAALLHRNYKALHQVSSALKYMVAWSEKDFTSRETWGAGRARVALMYAKEMVKYANMFHLLEPFTLTTPGPKTSGESKRRSPQATSSSTWSNFMSNGTNWEIFARTMPGWYHQSRRKPT